MRRDKLHFFSLLVSFLLPFCPLETEAAVINEAPDIETSSECYRKRFKGRTGKWFLRQQEEYLFSVLNSLKGRTILDVGGGHGQYTRGLVERGYAVTVLGSSSEADTQVRDLVASKQCRYLVGNLTDLPAADKSYDVVISFRLMTHLQDWRGFIAEAARVARHAVVIDFPVLRSFNALYPMFFWLKRAYEGDTTRSFHVFSENQIIAAFGQDGFFLTDRRAQYFFPMVVHRVLHAQFLSMAIEKACSSLGLTSRFGSPVILCVQHTASDDGVLRRT